MRKREAKKQGTWGRREEHMRTAKLVVVLAVLMVVAAAPSFAQTCPDYSSLVWLGYDAFSVNWTSPNPDMIGGYQWYNWDVTLNGGQLAGANIIAAKGFSVYSFDQAPAPSKPPVPFETSLVNGEAWGFYKDGPNGFSWATNNSNPNNYIGVGQSGDFTAQVDGTIPTNVTPPGANYTVPFGLALHVVLDKNVTIGGNTGNTFYVGWNDIRNHPPPPPPTPELPSIALLACSCLLGLGLMKRRKS